MTKVTYTIKATERDGYNIILEKLSTSTSNLFPNIDFYYKDPEDSAENIYLMDSNDEDDNGNEEDDYNGDEETDDDVPISLENILNESITYYIDLSSKDLVNSENLEFKISILPNPNVLIITDTINDNAINRTQQSKRIFHWEIYIDSDQKGTYLIDIYKNEDFDLTQDNRKFLYGPPGGKKMKYI